MTDMRSNGQGFNLVDSVYERLLAERIIFLGSQVDDDIANKLCAQILLLSAEDATKDIHLYINSPGGSISAGMAVYDTMVLAPCDIATYAMGMAASMGEFLLAAGTKGKRYALPHARILMHQPLGGITGGAADIAIQAEQFAVIKKEMFRLNAEFTGQSIERIEADSDRDRWFTAPEALDYGFVDHIITNASVNGSEAMTDQTDPRLQPQARYILPSFIEHSSFGVKESNPYNKLFEERIIFLGVQVDDASANDIMAQLLVLESLDPDRDITMYINSPGGSFTSLMAIYDTMQYVRADIQTVCLGQAASAAAVLLAAGTPGKRMALPNARILIHQPALSGVIQGQFSDLEIQAKEIERMRTLMETTLAHHTGRDAAQIRKDTDRDKILTAEEAKDYGVIDTVLEYRKLSAQTA